MLDADMRTLLRWTAQAWRWWLGELAAIVPAPWRRRGGAGYARLAVIDDALVINRARGGRRARRGQRAIVAVPASWCLVRTIERPRIGERDVQRMAALEGAVLLPLPAEAMVTAARIAGPTSEPARIAIDIAALPIERARHLGVLVAAERVAAARVVMAEASGTAAPLDFAPAMRAAGLLAPIRSATPLLWGVVAALCVLNLVAAIVRDRARTERWEALVADQAPALAVAQTIARRGVADRRLVIQSAALRARHDALGDLARVAGALPPGAWLQRYGWDGASVRLTGYRPPRLDVQGALRRAGGLAEVRSASDEAQPAVPAGQPFDLTARLR